MSTDRGASRLLDVAALGLLAAHAALRLSLRGGEGSWGSNLTTHLLVPVAAAVWLTARALERRATWRWTGLEIPLAALAALAIISTFGASFRLAALDGAAGWCSAILAAPLAIHVFGSESRRSLVAMLAALAAVVALFGCLQYVQLGDLQSTRETAAMIAQAEDPGELAARVADRQPWSTLNYPNTFAGFLVLSLPLLVGIAIDGKSVWVVTASAATAAAAGFGLWASGSLGAWVATAGAIGAFAILEALRRWPSRRTAILYSCGGLIVLGGALMVAGPLSPNSLAKKSESLAIRDVYWDAALKVAKAHPFGVGINNFEDHYYQLKDDRQEEVRHVHNDYLQALVEMGIPGLLAFIALLAVVFSIALRPSSVEPYGSAQAPVGAGLAAGWLLAFGLQGAFGDAAIALLMCATGIAAYRLFSRAILGEFTRMGLIAGLAGAAIHFMVDFDLADPAFRHFFFLGLAALALMSRLEPGYSGGALAPAIAAIVLFALVLPLGALLAPRFLESEELASAAASDADTDRLLEESARANPLDPDPAVRRGLREFQAWRKGRADNSELILAVLEDAIRRRPRLASLEARLAEVHEAVGRRARERADSGIDAAAGEAHVLEAEKHARLAVELYPTRADHRYLLGRILDLTGSADAADEFREALRLSSLAVRVPRLRLDGVEAAFATLKTGGTHDRAIEILREWFRKESSGPGFDQRWRERLEMLAPEEKSIVDAAGVSK